MIGTNTKTRRSTNLATPYFFSQDGNLFIRSIKYPFLYARYENMSIFAKGIKINHLPIKVALGLFHRYPTLEETQIIFHELLQKETKIKEQIIRPMLIKRNRYKEHKTAKM